MKRQSAEALTVADKFNLAFKGAMKGDLAPIQVYLGAKGDVNRKDKFGWTLVMQASYKGHIDILRYLVQHKKAKINLVDKDGRNALYHACFHGFSEVAGFLLTQYSEIDLATVMKAAAKGILSVVQYWVNLGRSVEDVEEDDPDETRLLMHACSGGHVHVARFLIENPKAACDVDAQDAGGKTALTYCCQNNHLHTADFLIEKCSAKVNYYTARKAAAKNFMKILKHFIEEDEGHVNETDSQGWTFLMDAAFHGQIEAAQYLMSCGADLNLKERNGHTALYWACYKGHTNLARILLEAGSQIDLMTLVKMTEPNQVIEVCKAFVGAGGELMKTDEKGRSLLSWACYEGRVDLCHWLVNVMEADINQSDSEGNTPLVWAQYSKKWDVAEFLIKVGAKNVFETVKVAAENGVDGVIRAYADAGHDMNKTDKRKATLLMKAAKWGKLKTMVTLVALGAKLALHDERGKTALDYLPNAMDEKDIVKKLGAELEDCQGNTLAHIAAEDGNLHMIEILHDVFHAQCIMKENKAGWTPLDMAMKHSRVQVVLYYSEMDNALESYNDQGETPFHRCCRWGHVTVLQALLCNLEDEKRWHRMINMPSLNEGNTCLMTACKWGWMPIIEFLIDSKSADVTLRNTAGKEVLHIAAENQHVDVVKYLLRHPQVHVDRKCNFGFTAAESCFIANLVDAVPLVFKRLEQRLPQESFTNFGMANNFLARMDPHGRIFSFNNLNLVATNIFEKQSGILSYNQLKESNFLTKGKDVLNDEIKVLYISLHWDSPIHPDSRGDQFSSVQGFLKEMRKKRELEFDYIYYPFGCMKQNDDGHDEEALAHEKAFPLAFLVASHTFVTCREVEGVHGNVMSNVEALAKQAWNSTEIILSQMLGNPVYICLRFNQDCVYELLASSCQNSIYTTSERLIRSWSHLSNRQSKILWRNWCRARDISCLQGLTTMALKHCNSVNLFKVLSMSQVKRNFQKDHRFLKAFFHLGDLHDEQDRIMLFRTLCCMVAYLLNYKVHDVGRPQSSAVNEDEVSDDGTETDGSAEYLNPVERERERRDSIQRSIVVALQQKKAIGSTPSSPIETIPEQTEKDQSADVHHLRVKLTYAEKETQTLKAEFKLKIIEYETKLAALQKSLEEEQEKRKVLSEEVLKLKQESVNDPSMLGDSFGGPYSFNVSRKNSIAGWSVTDDNNSFSPCQDHRGRALSNLTNASECSAALPFMIDNIEKRNSNANVRVEVIQSQIKFVEQQFLQLQARKTPTSKNETPSPTKKKRFFADIVQSMCVTNPDDLFGEEEEEVEIIAS